MPPVTPLKRRSCDRCHAQKLRCPRQSGSDSCSRCLRMGVPCVFSAPLPKGRPSSHRGAGGANARLPAAVPHSPRASHPSQPASAPPSTSTSYTLSTGVSGLGFTSLGDLCTSWPSTGEGSAFPAASVQPDLPDWMWPWPADPSWTDLASADLHPTTTTATASAANVDAESLSNTFASSTQASTDSSAPSTSGHSPRMDHLPKLWPPNPDATEICIKQLSDLSARLYPVYKTSCAFATAQHEHPGPLITTAAFDTVAALLESPNTSKPPAPGKCNALHETFNASRNLLDIVYRFQANSTNPSSTTITTQSPTPDATNNSDDWMGIMLSASLSNRSPGAAVSGPGHESSIHHDGVPCHQNPPSSPGSTSTNVASLSSFSMTRGTGENRLHSNVVRHLILACYTLLLHIYSALISALHHDASCAKGIGPNSPPSSVELRLVLLMQLITHLLDRLQQIMDVYASQVDKQAAAMKRTLREQHGCMDMSHVDLENIAELESNISYGLKQLQQTLQS